MTGASDPNHSQPKPQRPHQRTQPQIAYAYMHLGVCMDMYACMHVRIYTCDSLIDGVEICNDVLQFGQHCLNAHAHSLLPFGSLANRSAQHIAVTARPVCVCLCALECVYICDFAYMCVYMYMYPPTDTYTHTHIHTDTQTHRQNRTWLQQSGAGLCCRPPSIWRRGVASGAWRG